MASQEVNSLISARLQTELSADTEPDARLFSLLLRAAAIVSGDVPSLYQIAPIIQRQADIAKRFLHQHL